MAIKKALRPVTAFAPEHLFTRVGKNEGTSQTYPRDGIGFTAPAFSDGIGHFTPGVSEHVASATTFNHKDQLGSYVAQTNSSQAVSATLTFDAFGLLVASSGAVVGPFGFVGDSGYETDASGLQLLGHRYYDPSTGRFLTRDPVKRNGNWYRYTSNNPQRYNDPTGLQSWKLGKIFLPDDSGFEESGLVPVSTFQYRFGRQWQDPDGEFQIEFIGPTRKLQGEATKLLTTSTLPSMRMAIL